MIFPGPPKTFIQCLNACVGGLEMIPPEEREGNLPFTPYQDREKSNGLSAVATSILRRRRIREGSSHSASGRRATEHIHPSQAMAKLANQGEIGRRLAEYSLAFSSLSEGDARIASLRYDLDPGNATPNSPDWDEELRGQHRPSDIPLTRQFSHFQASQ